MSTKFSGITKEILNADLVIGDHSQALLNSAMHGKVIGSINLSGRRSFFHDYTKFGIPYFKSSNQLNYFINHKLTNKNYLNEYNEVLISVNKNNE